MKTIQNILPLSNIGACSLLRCFRTQPPPGTPCLLAGMSVKPRTDELRKEEEEGVVRGGKDNPIAKQKKHLASQQHCFLLSVLVLPHTAATGDALNHCCWGVVLIPKEENNIGVS